MQDGGWEIITDPSVVHELMQVPPLPADAAMAPATVRDGIPRADLEQDTLRDGIPLRVVRCDKDPR
jgi:hypothetical protein